MKITSPSTREMMSCLKRRISLRRPPPRRSRRSLGIHQEVIACTIERIQKAPPIAGSPLLDVIRDFEELDLSEWMKLCAHFLRPHALLRSPRRLVSLLLCR